MSLRPSHLIADASSFKIHMAADGRLWCAEEDKEPVPVADSVPAFLESSVFRRCRRFRIIATPAHSTLIARLFETARVPIDLITPRLELSAAELADPREAILQARSRNKLPVCLGGWHQMTVADFVPYALADAIQQKKPREELVKLLWRHPAASSWSFPKLNDAVALAGVVAAIRDPRWFVDRHHPDRLSSIMRYMGMDQRTMSWALGRSSKPVGPNDRARLVLNAWYSKTPPTRAEIQQPNHFVWHHLVNSRSANPELRTCQVFLAYLCKTWIHALVPRRSEPLFQPEYYFHRPQDVGAYKMHVKHWDK